LQRERGYTDEDGKITFAELEPFLRGIVGVRASPKEMRQFFATAMRLLRPDVEF